MDFKNTEFMSFDDKTQIVKELIDVDKYKLSEYIIQEFDRLEDKIRNLELGIEQSAKKMNDGSIPKPFKT